MNGMDVRCSSELGLYTPQRARRLFAVPANRDLFLLVVWEEKEGIRSVIESMLLAADGLAVRRCQ